MPNTAVKAANAESTWGEAPWEDRKPLIQQRSTSIMKCFFFCIKQRSRFKQRIRFKGPKGRINLRESLTPKQGLVWQQLFFDGCRRRRKLPKSSPCGFLKDGSRRRPGCHDQTYRTLSQEVARRYDRSFPAMRPFFLRMPRATRLPQADLSNFSRQEAVMQLV